MLAEEGAEKERGVLQAIRTLSLKKNFVQSKCGAALCQCDKAAIECWLKALNGAPLKMRCCKKNEGIRKFYGVRNPFCDEVLACEC